MIHFFAKLWIKDWENTSSPLVRQRYGILCGILGIVLNAALFLGKFLAGIFSNSIAITADAFNNLSDAGSSFITLIGFKIAAQEPDPHHPFGHGRMEYLSGLMVAGAILIMAYELITSSLQKIRYPEETSYNLTIIMILLISVIVKLYMAFYNYKIGEKIDSAAMKATGTDSLGDTLSTAIVLAAALISHFFDIQIDGYCGILVGIFILFAGINAAKDTINPLLGQPPAKEFVEEVEKIVLNFEGVLGMHDLIVHDYGPGRVIISLHAEVSSTGDILEIHDMIDLLEHKLKNQLHCEAVIHMDPIVTDDKDINFWKEYVHEIILHIDESLHMHDFRMVKGNTHTNLIFDLVVPYNFKMSNSELIQEIQAQVWKRKKNYFVVAEIEHSYLSCE